jgi:ribosome modulation factor
MEKSRAQSAPTIYASAVKQHAYAAGYDCGLNGGNTTNCHFSLFSTRELTEAWEHGKRDGDAAKAGGAQ